MRRSQQGHTRSPQSLVADPMLLTMTGLAKPKDMLRGSGGGWKKKDRLEAEKMRQLIRNRVSC